MSMIGKFGLRKNMALAASLALAGSAIFSSAASAVVPRDPACEAAVANACAIFWQDLGYAQVSDCSSHQKCVKCPPLYGYMCGLDPRGYNSAIRDEQPW
jgi:hypothetical protein